MNFTENIQNQPVKQPVKARRVSRTKRWLYVSVFYSLFAAFVLFIAYGFYQSPKEYMLQKQNIAYAAQLAELKEKISAMEESLQEVSMRDDMVYRVVFEMKPIPEEQRSVGYGGADRYFQLRGYKNSDDLIETAERLDKLGRQMYVEYRSLDKISRTAKLKEKKLTAVPSIKPVSTGVFSYISSPYGFRYHPKSHKWKKHTGIDIAVRYGTPVYATGDGIVQESFRDRYYGRMVLIDHGFGYQSLYAHMSKLAVKKGAKIKRGQIVGYVGNSGLSTGTHLHYEVIKNGYRVNPRKYYEDDLPPGEYGQIVHQAKTPEK
jgi:murein DD-endopeptidase MepM/ murein hydrolase activator NlpD